MNLDRNDSISHSQYSDIFPAQGKVPDIDFYFGHLLLEGRV